MDDESLLAVVDICSLICFHVALEEEEAVAQYLAEQFRAVPRLYRPTISYEHHRFRLNDHDDDVVRAFTR